MITTRIASHVPPHHPDVSFGSGQKREKSPEQNEYSESDKHVMKKPDNSVPVARRRRTPVRFAIHGNAPQLPIRDPSDAPTEPVDPAQREPMHVPITVQS
eukprot:11376508-Karenia_brevis.AAC.1